MLSTSSTLSNWSSEARQVKAVEAPTKWIRRIHHQNLAPETWTRATTIHQAIPTQGKKKAHLLFVYGSTTHRKSCGMLWETVAILRVRNRKDCTTNGLRNWQKRTIRLQASEDNIYRSSYFIEVDNLSSRPARQSIVLLDLPDLFIGWPRHYPRA